MQSFEQYIIEGRIKDAIKKLKNKSVDGILNTILKVTPKTNPYQIESLRKMIGQLIQQYGNQIPTDILIQQIQNII
jgi:hypothetical protein